ncbi:uncharacterized protein N7496_000325 [Penicillium cataractarum]|uniref:Uncharacterized protein n=1 Tax=Penicillium cataractarum TaxID=2100454 RepID=A0A9X0B5Z6_9EURO|nr:uncharacterized protein N7496_000325 [Penicillium cataractarum]KAJ5389257.1 hypothetical protein N7496_000325 [Penicillium cataractarum]
MDTDLYDLGHFLYIATGQGRPEIVVISDEELSDLRIQFHHLDIETGDVSPSPIPCFLPKTDLPEVLDEDDFYPDIFSGAEEAIVSLKVCGWSRNISGVDIFPHCLELDLQNFSFEKNYDLVSQFRGRDEINIYGWIEDHENYERAWNAGDDSYIWERFEALRMRSYLMQTMIITLDCYGHSGVLAGYSDGQLHVQFSRMVDFNEYAVEPPEGTPYIDVVDRSKLYDMLNILAKWSWPIPVATTKEYAAVILDLPTDDHPDTDFANDDWLLVQDMSD